MSDAFKGGSKMEQVLAEMVQKLGPGRFVKVGFLEGGMAGWEGPRPKNGKKTTTKQDNQSGHQEPAPMVAFWHEYGTNRMPARPFFRPMIERKSPTWGKLLLAMLKLSKYNGAKALADAGFVIGEQLRDSILELKSPALAQSTIDNKGFNILLIDSHNMIRSISEQVEGGEQIKIDESV